MCMQAGIKERVKNQETNLCVSLCQNLCVNVCLRCKNYPVWEQGIINFHL